MDFTLRCNSLKCRTQLSERAVVTTCSHIFCINCSETLGLAAANGPNRNCPACRAPLANPDDVVATSLNPTEDYKTSVLSGLSPTIIMECASRGLTFWSYQATQEVVYQEYLAKTLTDKYSTLNLHMDKLVNDANTEIDGLNQRLSQLQLDQEKLKQDNQTLLNALREKNKKHAQTQDLYERLKRKEMTAATQHAAVDSVDDVLLQAANAASHHGSGPGQWRGTRGTNNGLQMHAFGGPSEGANNNNTHSRPNPHGPSLHIHTDNQETPKQSFLGDRFANSNNIPGAVVPSVHRTRLGGGGGGGVSSGVIGTHPQHQQTHGISGPLFQRASNLHHNHHNHHLQHLHQHGIGQTPQIRRPLESISGNASAIRRENLNAGYGISAGMRAGSLQGGLPEAGNRGGSWIG